MKNIYYYLRPVIIMLVLFYAVGVAKSLSLNPAHFGYKTRVGLSVLWMILSFFALTMRRVKREELNYE